MNRDIELFLSGNNRSECDDIITSISYFFSRQHFMFPAVHKSNNQIMTNKTYEDVLDFWFGSKISRDYLKQKSFWYGSPSVDTYVRQNLGETYQSAKDGNLDDWISTGDGEGALALILLLDQVPRNIFRGTPQANATDQKALLVARHAIDRGWDMKLPGIQRRYRYSPFNHSEDFEGSGAVGGIIYEIGDPDHLHWAKDFRDQIKRDGRFKHRDIIFGRS